MSSQHVRPLVAFLVVSVVCALVMIHAVRADSLADVVPKVFAFADGARPITARAEAGSRLGAGAGPSSVRVASAVADRPERPSTSASASVETAVIAGTSHPGTTRPTLTTPVGTRPSAGGRHGATPRPTPGRTHSGTHRAHHDKARTDRQKQRRSAQRQHAREVAHAQHLREVARARKAAQHTRAARPARVVEARPARVVEARPAG